MRLMYKRAAPHGSSKVFCAGVLGFVALVMLAGCSESDPEPETPGTRALVSLVTAEQYRNSLSYIFGPGVDLQVEFAPVARTEGLLANSAAIAGIGSSQLQGIQGVAASVASQVLDTKHRNYLVPCRPESIDGPDEACATRFLSRVGRLLFRRALTDDEVAMHVKQAGSAAEQLESFYAGLEIALEGMLISPEGLFVVERAEPDPENPGQLRLDAYSLASRLSYFLWNSAPDDELLAAAESGELQASGGLERAVDRMLASPRLAEGMRAFLDDMFAFDEVKTLTKDSTIYPEFTRVTAEDAREQTLRTSIEHLLANDGDYRDLFTTRSTVMSPALAIIYGVPAEPGWTPHTFPDDSPRSGLLTQVSFLSLHAHPGRSSVTLRGQALRERFLCQTVPEPPPGIDFSVVSNPDANYPTQRQRVRAHLETPSCAGCHRITDPIGLSLERFDGAGGFRLTENGAVIDASGGLDGFEFEGAVGLGKALRENPELPRCLVQRVYSYGTGAPPAMEARPALDYFNAEFAARGYRLRELLRTIALSKAFSRVQNDPGEESNPEYQEESRISVASSR
ncbi:DUF1592 domain-containing protein [Chromatocurvus halotolerans]|uniref:Uncharacterized protein DUF1595 n=1 Tax=Chromatocurvus halotolerans TaxID=1132028 RepID=A0A4R2L020_9GAMM|nr:DUF1592 domain-containing protein [Chromatocurvus halotolerans]TCO75878.1 uncharacterized protein DUF1595 [Chromatocurvus halotolerans]